MGLLGSTNKRGQLVTPQARDIRARVQGNGQVNLDKLKSLRDRHATRSEYYKLKQDGTVRFRLVLPMGGDDVPMAIADQHFLPVADETGKRTKRAIYCMNSFGIDCPICRLSAMLQNSNDADLIDGGHEIRCTSRWAMYVVNRDYLAESDDPIAEHDPKKDKVALLAVPKGIGEDIIEYMQKRVWIDPQDPDTGYDFEVVGKKRGGSSPWPEYTITPQPRDSSPAYDVNLLKGIKPLSQVIVPAKVEDIDKVLTPILMSLSESSDEGAYVVEEFTSLWNDFKETNKNGIIVPESVREDDPDIDNAADDSEAYVEESAAVPAPKPAAKRPVAATTKQPEPPMEPEVEEAGEDDNQEGEDIAPEGDDAEDTANESVSDTEEDAGDTEQVEEEPEQPVARPAPRPVAKAPVRPAIARPAAPVARPAPAAAPATSMKSRLAAIGKGK